VSTEPASARPSAAPDQAPNDADDLRGFYFGLLLRRPFTWVATVVATIAAGVVAAAFLGPGLGAAVAGAVLLLSLLIVFAIADSRSEGAFFEVYAGQHGLLLSGKGRLPPATPLLRKGDDRYAERALRGPLGDDVDGVLALYTYEEETTDSKGNRQTSYYRYTVGLVDVPECAPHVSELLCQRKFGLRALEKLEDAFRSKQRVKLESEVLDERYEIFAGKEQDQVWLRRFFSPTFVVWLGEEAPQKFAFELVAGALCCYVSGHKKNAAELDTVRAAAATVAKRLCEEALETA
jgi:hypothetical protein